MNKIFVFIFFILTFCSNAQKDDINKKFYFNFGVNMIDNNGDRDPTSILGEFDDVALSNPIIFGINYGVSNDFEIYFNASLNKFKEGQSIDGVQINDDKSYTSFDSGLRFYPYTLEINGIERIDLYTQAGVGRYKISVPQVTANIGFGTLFRVGTKTSIFFNSVAKFSLDNQNFQSNLFQHSLGVRFLLNNSYCSCRL